jgi:hypothetical protein
LKCFSLFYTTTLWRSYFFKILQRMKTLSIECRGAARSHQFVVSRPSPNRLTERQSVKLVGLQRCLFSRFWATISSSLDLRKEFWPVQSVYWFVSLNSSYIFCFVLLVFLICFAKSKAAPSTIQQNFWFCSLKWDTISLVQTVIFPDFFSKFSDNIVVQSISRSVL